MFRAAVEPMPTNPPDRVPRTGLWKVVIYDDERFVRTDKEHITYSAAKKRAEDLNLNFDVKRHARGA